MWRQLASVSLLLCPLVPAVAATPAADRSAERDLYRQVVEIPTVAGRGQMPRLVKLLADRFRAAGITDIQIKPHGNTQTMIVRWRAPTPDKRPMLLMAHMDVVEANRADWDVDPFKFQERDGYFWGRGVADNKAGVVGLTASILRLKAQGFQPRRDIILLFTGDEETKQDGARLAATEWRPLIDAEFALNSDAGGGRIYKDGRPERFTMQLAEKTYADFRFKAVNRGGHSSAPRPDNAIYAVAGAMKALEQYRFKPMLNAPSRASFEAIARTDRGLFGELVSRWLAEPDNGERADLIEAIQPGSTRTRCVATQISGGHAPNALPQHVEANVNCRIFPGVPVETVRQQLQSIAGPDVTVELVEGGATSDPTVLRDDVLQAYREAVQRRFPGVEIVPTQSAGASDAVFLRAAGIPTYGVGGLWSFVGDQSGVHGLNERVPVKAFEDSVDIWQDIIARLAG